MSPKTLFGAATLSWGATTTGAGILSPWTNFQKGLNRFLCVGGFQEPFLENLVATHRLKRLQFLEDREGYRYELNYLRESAVGEHGRYLNAAQRWTASGQMARGSTH